MRRNRWLWWGVALLVGGVLVLVVANVAPGLGRSPIGLDGARTVVDQYLARLGDKQFAIAELWGFTAGPYYAAIEERTGGRGAFELLVDRYTGAISPEPGPNMMWNLKYGMMGGGSMMGGFMMGGGYPGGGFGPGMMGYRTGWGPAQFGAEPRMTGRAAQERAQAYLNQALPGAKVRPGGHEFYGYWTLHFDRDGQLAGMLSVNAATGDVWPHTWHAAPTEVVGEK